jgi:hypothetical protein
MRKCTRGASETDWKRIMDEGMVRLTLRFRK